MANNSYRSLIKRWREKTKNDSFYHNLVNSVNYLDSKSQILNVSVFILPQTFTLSPWRLAVLILVRKAKNLTT